MKKDSRIYVAGHTGLVGSALVRILSDHGYHNLILCSHAELDLCDQQKTGAFFNREKPEYVFLAAAKVGGIMANNTYRAQFIYDNIATQTNVLHAAYLNGVKKLLFLGSSCIYPRNCAQPIKEEYLLTGSLEPTNEPYAIAKIAGLKMCEAYNHQYGTQFIAVMPTNLYGPNDHYDLEAAHVLPSLIRKFVEAKEQNLSNVTVWGTGNPRREFLHVDDAAEACLLLMNLDDNNYRVLGISHINIGAGEDMTIAELVALIRTIVGYQGDVIYDTTKPDGMFQKLLDVSRLKSFGWHPKITFEQGLANTIEWYRDHAEAKKNR
ncbi:MAG: hypothetical protein ACD_62C00312G0009 [uncultured bacterium]|nr:MAG: hypothetical protein ACD_62C00312G0009 [uncultured bacterium]